MLIEQILITGFVKGGIYAVLVAGLSLMFGVARILNLSYTGFYMVSAYLMFISIRLFHFPSFLGATLAILLTTILGMISYVLIIDRIKAYEITVMIISMAIAILFQEILISIFSGDFQTVPPFIQGFMEIGGVRIAYQKLFTILVSLGIIGGLQLLLTKTWMGVAIRAVAQDREIANLMGVNVNRICLITTTIALTLAAIAGVMVAPIMPVHPHMWIPPLMVVLASIVFGGMGSLKGSILAAFILAYTETLVVFLVPKGSFLIDAVLLVVMALVLLIRPEGLFGMIFEEERL
jgi:branched-chain amino acid transport system permease protein